MKRSLPLLLAALLAAILVACQAAPSPRADALLGDAELDAAQPLGAASLQALERDLALEALDLAAIRAGDAPTAGLSMPANATLGSQALAVDAAGRLAYVYTVGDENFVLVRRNDSDGVDFPVGYVLYRGNRTVDSVAVSADGELTVFAVADGDGEDADTEVYLYDRTGDRTGAAGQVVRLTDNDYDDLDVDLSLDGTVLTWKAEFPDGTPLPVLGLLDPAGPALTLIGLDYGVPGVQPSVSGDGSLLVFNSPDLFGEGADLGVLIQTADFAVLATPEWSDANDPSVSDTGRVLVETTADGTTDLALYDDSGELIVNLFDGRDTDHPKITADGSYFTYSDGGDVFARLIDVADPAAAEETAVAATRNRTEYAAHWAKRAFEIAYDGSTVGGPTIVRPDQGGGLDDAQRTSPYDAFTFTAPVTDFYEFVSEQQYDGYILVYEAPFDAEAPEANLLAFNDDRGSGYDPDAAPPGTSRVVAELTGGEDYVLVTTACGDPAAGCGPDTGGFTNTVTRGAPAPLPPYTPPAPDPSGYDITIRFVSDNLSEAQAAAFTDAAARWSAIITGDLEDAEVSLPQDFSFPNTGPVEGTIDDVLIDVNFTNIDGPSGILGRAGPRLIRTEESANPDLTVYGIMEFDISEFGDGGFFDDAQAYEDVIVHEMGHVLGIGTLWNLTGNVEGQESDPATAPPGLPNPDYDPRFTGPLAVAEYQALLEAKGFESEASVPVANTGGPGNYNGHWRELSFDDELMTPYAAGIELLSRLTAASLGDIGYTVDLGSSAIDPDYLLPDPRVPGRFEQTAPQQVAYTEVEDFLVASESPKTIVTGAVTNVDLNLADLANSDSGCEAADFDGFPAGDVALVRRGTCTFITKIENATAAGATAVIIMNQGNAADRSGVFSPGGIDATTVPVVAITTALGEELAAIDGLEVLIDPGVEEPALRAEFTPFEEVLGPVGTLAPDGTITLFDGVVSPRLEPYKAD